MSLPQYPYSMVHVVTMGGYTLWQNQSFLQQAASDTASTITQYNGKVRGK